jgi:hypothetical protein
MDHKGDALVEFFGGSNTWIWVLVIVIFCFFFFRGGFFIANE